MKTTILAILFSISIFGQTLKVTTLSGTTAASVCTTNNGYNNGTGNVSTYLFPLGVAVASNGTVYAFDDYVNVIRKIQPDGLTSQFCGNSTFTSPSFSIGYADGNSTTALFSNITAIAVDKQDNIYVMDYNRLRKVTPAGNVTTITTNQIEFKDAQGICLDASGNIYVADTGKNRVRKVTPQGVITTIASGFRTPKGICIDSSGNLYVSDSENTVVKKINSSGVVSVYATGFASPSGIGIDASGYLYVADSFNHVIYKVTTSGAATNFAGSGFGNFRDGPVGFARTSASFYNPQGITVSTTGVVYVADTYSQRIRKISNQ